ncbi:hypothetical protein [Ammoniphilus sp. 3BR4]|uniref:hypothetical protein n=1 Tax=Ammoniphilus sp. 3BR4 TaxID=3158265 RepID=UPI0034671DA7
MGKSKSLKKMRKAAKQLKGKPILYRSSKGVPYVVSIKEVKGDKVLLKANRIDSKKAQQVGFSGLGGSGLLGGLGGAQGLGGLGGALGGGLSMIVPMIRLFSVFGPNLLLKGLGGLSGLGVGGSNPASSDGEN